MSQLTRTKGILARVKAWETRVEDVETALLLVEDEDLQPREAADMLSEAQGTLRELTDDLERWQVESLLNGPYDQAGCRLYLTAGVGGADASDWAGILMRMYER